MGAVAVTTRMKTDHHGRQLCTVAPCIRQGEQRTVARRRRRTAIRTVALSYFQSTHTSAGQQSPSSTEHTTVPCSALPWSSLARLADDCDGDEAVVENALFEVSLLVAADMAIGHGIS